MPENPLSLELQRFLARYVHSVEQLEILCLLVEQPDKFWRVEEVFRSVQSSQPSVAQELAYFAEAGFLKTDSQGGYRFSPTTPELAQAAVQLVQTYRERRVSIVEAIYRAPLDPIRHFADAFRLRKDPPL